MSKQIYFEQKPTYVKSKATPKEKPEKPESKSSNNSFTSEFQFKDAQSNVVNDSAMQTEVRTWEDGYGPQGGLLPS